MKKVLKAFVLAVLTMAVAISCSTGKTYTIVSYNVGVFGKYQENSSPVIASMMKEAGADIVMMNELDRFNSRHDTDQLADFAALMGWDYFYVPAMEWNGGLYGNGAAYRKDLKPVDRFIISIPKDTGSEDRSCGVIEFEDLVVAGTHLDVKAEEDRVRGVRIITENLKSRYGNGEKPVFVCGDMNSLPDSRTIAEFRKDWDQLTPSRFTHPSDSPDKCIDYIFALKGVGRYKVDYAEAGLHFETGDVEVASDHLPVCVRISIK